MKQGLDERQEVIVNKIGAVSFYVMFAAKFVVCFFLAITILCFIVLLVMGKIAQHRTEEQEKKYSE